MLKDGSEKTLLDDAQPLPNHPALWTHLLDGLVVLVLRIHPECELLRAVVVAALFHREEEIHGAELRAAVLLDAPAEDLADVWVLLGVDRSQGPAERAIQRWQSFAQVAQVVVPQKVEQRDPLLAHLLRHNATLLDTNHICSGLSKGAHPRVLPRSYQS